MSIGTGIYRVSVKNKANIFPTANHFTRCEDEISVERYFTEIRHGTGEELPCTRQLLLAIFSRKEICFSRRKKVFLRIGLETINVKKENYLRK